MVGDLAPSLCLILERSWQLESEIFIHGDEPTAKNFVWNKMSP